MTYLPEIVYFWLVLAISRLTLGPGYAILLMRIRFAGRSLTTKMNYGYNTSCEGYKIEKENILARKLNTLIQKYFSDMPSIDKPYIELDGLYDGVRIRKITHLSEPWRKKLVKKADKIFEEVMLKK